MSKPGLSACGLVASMACAFVATALADEPAKPASSRPFIETSYIIAPLHVGDFMLEDSEYDENNKAGGAGFRYALKGHQESRIDVFVYPEGELDRSAAMEQGMAEFKAGIQGAEKAGYYSGVSSLDESEFPLLLKEQPETAGKADLKTTDKDDVLGAVIGRGMNEATTPTGRKLQMQFVMQPIGTPMRSNGYLFYKQLYFFKVRVSASQDRIDETAFHALADQAARTLVPAIEVANVGGCSDKVITMGKADDRDEDEIAKEILTKFLANSARHCFASMQEAEIDQKSKDARVVTIAYGPGDWKSQ